MQQSTKRNFNELAIQPTFNKKSKYKEHYKIEMMS